MGLFDELIDGLIDLPAEIVEKSVEVVARIPEAGIKVVKGAVDGLEKAAEKLEESL